MPKVTLNPTFDEFRGSIGNLVYQEGREGTVSRSRTVPTNPRTAAQTGARSAFSRATEAYKSLTTAQVTAWTNYAKTITRRGYNGKSFHPTPSDVFVGLSSKFLQVNPAGTFPVLPPAASFIGDVITLTAAGAAGKVTFTASAPNVSGATTELLLQALKSKNRVPDSKNYRTKAFFVFPTGTLSKDVTVPAGEYAPAYRFVNPLTGQTTALTALPTVQVS